MEHIDDEILTEILGLAVDQNLEALPFYEEKRVPVHALRFAAVSSHWRLLATSDAIWAAPFERLSKAFGLANQIYEMEENAQTMIPPYTGPSLRQPHRTPILTMPTRIAFGQIEDPFYPTNQKALPAEKRTLSWVVRAPPFVCCGGKFLFDTNAEMVQHLKSWQHQKHVPEEWCDPRLLDPAGFNAASCYSRYKRLHTFVSRMLRAFAEMEDPSKWGPAERAHLTKMANRCKTWALDRLPDDFDMESEDADSEENELLIQIDDTSPELIASVCVGTFGTEPFREHGVTGDALDLLSSGLSRFNPMNWGSCSLEQFMNGVYPPDEYPTSVLYDYCSW